MRFINNLIIGAGPAGLAIAGRLRKANLEFEIIEQSDLIASKWHHHYDRLHLHTIKEYSHLPYMPFPGHYATYISKANLVEYYEAYAAKFDIKPIYRTTAEQITKSEGLWHVKSNAEIYTAKNLIIATGTNRIPNIPQWPGEQSFEGEILHASQYKNASPYLNQNVLVVGMGNTGAEIALDLAENNVNVGISIRSKQSIVPRDLFGRPIQKTALLLDKLPWDLGAHIGNLVRKLYFGDLTEYGIPVDTKPPIKLLRETGKTPTIDLGTIAQIKAGKISMHGDISHFQNKKVNFKDGKSMRIDTVVLATGYFSKLDELLPEHSDIFNPKGEPIDKIGEGENSGIYFIGFDNYKTGGILGTLRDDSRKIAEKIDKDRLTN